MVEMPEALIARRAFEISQIEVSGSAEENWHRAKRELREEAVAASPEGDRSPTETS